MTWTEKQRAERMHNVAVADQRGQFERDRDRVLYSSAFHRLAGITQIVRSDEEDVFHTRQQHSFKVAQVGRRLAQKCKADNSSLAKKYGLHEEVVEAACLAHDLGHPPFGHVGESALDELMTNRLESEGFEGNAQSFRIVSKLSVRFLQKPGLDLTRATLAACLKYPWLRDRNDAKKQKKWSVYESESEEFQFAREFHSGEEQTLEAHLMDWADDIAYSVHDLEDFHRCRAIPWWQIRYDKSRQKQMIKSAANSWFDSPKEVEEQLEKALQRLMDFFVGFENLLNQPYDGTREQRRALRTLTSQLIGRYIHAAKLDDTSTGLTVDPDLEAEVRLLKQITRDYIIGNPTLAAQQHGYRKIITGLFEAILNDIDGSAPDFPKFLPYRLAYLWEAAGDNHDRFAADSICSLTEREATALYARLSGAASGSVLDPIVR